MNKISKNLKFHKKFKFTTRLYPSKDKKEHDLSLLYLPVFDA